MKKYDVIIVGAGISGIYAAKMLTEQGKSVLLIEARDRVGGRLYTKEIYNGVYTDLGGQWIGPTQDNMYQILKEYDTDFVPAFFEGKSIISLGRKNKTYKGIIPPLPVTALINLEIVRRKVNRLAGTINLEKPWETPNAKALDEITLHQWIKKNFPSKKAFKVIKIALESVFATSIKDISLLHALIYIKSGNDMESLIEVEGGAQQDKIQGGVQPLLEKMVKPFEDDLLLGCPVDKIIQEEDKAAVKTSRGVFQANKIIVTVPPAALENITFEPELPVNKKQFISRSFMGSAIKCYAVYEKPFWRSNGLNGMSITDTGFISLTFDNTSPKDDFGILLGFCVADEAKEFINFKTESQHHIIKKEFSQLFGKQAETPLKIHTEAWTSERWTNGCYSGMMPTNVWSTVGRAWREPFLNIHWAGTETSERWMGYMEGGVISAKRAVNEVLDVSIV